jgi:hypothetical protein
VARLTPRDFGLTRRTFREANDADVAEPIEARIPADLQNAAEPG